MTSGGQDNGAQEEKPKKGRKKGRNEDEEASGKDEYQLEIEAELKVLERHRHKALEILEHGDPLDFLLDTFNKIHVGDRDTAEVQFIAFGCQASCNSHGIQANWTGPSGKGKSAGAEACYHLLPKMFILNGSVSAKSLFYHKDLPDGACIFLDDFRVDEGSDLEATIKRSTSAFQEGAYHETLDGNRQLLRMRLPKRLCWTLTYVDVIESGDQFLNRMFVIKTDSSREADEQVCRHILLRAERGESALPLIEEVLISKAMMLDIKNKPPYRVVIPKLSERVSFTDRRNRRNPDLFVDLVIGLACLRHRQRKREHVSEGEWTLYANMEDIREAARVGDDLYYSLRPMLAVSRGRLLALSTPFGKRGWFFNEWSEETGWQKHAITALQCPRISREFLEEERRSMPAAWFNAEYMCEFTEAVDSVFSYEHVMAAVAEDVEPLDFGGEE